MASKEIAEFELRLRRHHDELRWLYMELYNNGSMFFELIEYLRKFYEERSCLPFRYFLLTAVAVFIIPVQIEELVTLLHGTAGVQVIRQLP